MVLKGKFKTLKERALKDNKIFNEIKEREDVRNHKIYIQYRGIKKTKIEL